MVHVTFYNINILSIIKNSLIYSTRTFENNLSMNINLSQDAKRVDDFDVSLILSYDPCPADLTENQKNVLSLKVTIY